MIIKDRFDKDMIFYSKIPEGVRIHEINLGDGRKAHGRPFAKVVTSIDFSKENGYAFQGEFLPRSREVDVPNGSLLLVVRGDGSWKHPHSTAYLFVVEDSEIVKKGSFDWTEKLTIRDEASKILEELGSEDLAIKKAEKLIDEAIKLVGIEKLKEIISLRER